MGIQAIDSIIIIAGIFSKKNFTLFTWFIPACCVVRFPIRCNLSDFLNLRGSTNKEKLLVEA